jgi:hypothetical protein
MKCCEYSPWFSIGRTWSLSCNISNCYLNWTPKCDQSYIFYPYKLSHTVSSRYWKCCHSFQLILPFADWIVWDGFKQSKIVLIQNFWVYQFHLLSFNSVAHHIVLCSQIQHCGMLCCSLAIRGVSLKNSLALNKNTWVKFQCLKF